MWRGWVWRLAGDSDDGLLMENISRICDYTLSTSLETLQQLVTLSIFSHLKLTPFMLDPTFNVEKIQIFYNRAKTPDRVR